MEYDFEPGDFVYLTSRGNMPALIISVIDEFYDDPKLYQAIGIGSRKYHFFCIAVCKKHFGDEETGEEGDIREYI